MMKSVVWIVLFVAVGGYLLASSVVAVKETEIVMVMQFGRPVAVIDQAGLTLKLPDPIQTTVSLDKRVQLQNLEPLEFSTLDQRNLVVEAFLIWKIVAPEVFLANVRNIPTARQRLTTLANSEIGAIIGGVPLGNVFSVSEGSRTLADIFERVSANVDAVTRREFGIEVLGVRPARLGFPKQNLLAIYKRMESERDRLAKQFQAEGQEEAAKIRSETEREIRQLKAQAYRKSQTIKGRSEAESARIYSDAFSENASFYKFMRYMESYEKILGEESRLVLSADSPLFRQLLTPPEAMPQP